MIRNIIAAMVVWATASGSAAAGTDRVPWWTPRRLVICDAAGCREAPDPYWEGPVRVQRPCREWRQCYWRQQWW